MEIRIPLDYLDDGQGGIWPLMTEDERENAPEISALADLHARRVEQDTALRETGNVKTIVAVCNRPDRPTKSLIDATAYAQATRVASTEGVEIDNALHNMFRIPLQLEKSFARLDGHEGGLEALPDGLQDRLAVLLDRALHPSVSVTRFLPQRGTDSDAAKP